VPYDVTTIAAIVDEVACQYGDSISAEHGIGRMKKAALQRYGDPVKLAVMGSVKRALNPNDIKNPGALL